MAFMQQIRIKWAASASGGCGGIVYNSYLFFGFSDCKSGTVLRPVCGPVCINCQSTISWYRGIYILECKMGEYPRPPSLDRFEKKEKSGEDKILQEVLDEMHYLRHKYHSHKLKPKEQIMSDREFIDYMKSSWPDLVKANATDISDNIAKLIGLADKLETKCEVLEGIVQAQSRGEYQR